MENFDFLVYFCYKPISYKNKSVYKSEYNINTRNYMPKNPDGVIFGFFQFFNAAFQQKKGNKGRQQIEAQPENGVAYLKICTFFFFHSFPDHLFFHRFPGVSFNFSSLSFWNLFAKGRGNFVLPRPAFHLSSSMIDEVHGTVFLPISVICV